MTAIVKAQGPEPTVFRIVAEAPTEEAAVDMIARVRGTGWTPVHDRTDEDGTEQSVRVGHGHQDDGRVSVSLYMTAPAGMRLTAILTEAPTLARAVGASS